MSKLSREPTLNNLIATNTYPQHRLPLIQKIQDLIGAKLITYIASPYHPLPAIIQQDIPFVEDLLRSSSADEGVLMINSPGGSGEAAEKILLMCRKRYPKSFRVIVPDSAKSAATMIALGSDQIIMGYLSELGPIDPQFMTDQLGPGIPARSLIDGLEIIREKVGQGDPIQLYYPMLSQIRPELIARAQSAIDESREFAEKWLKTYQLKDNPKQAKQVAEWLSVSDKQKRYKSHGKVINAEECAEELGLNVDCLSTDSELWNLIWELYGRSLMFLQQQPVAAKLFENDKISLSLNINLRQQMQPPQRQEGVLMPPTISPREEEKKKQNKHKN